MRFCGVGYLLRLAVVAACAVTALSIGSASAPAKGKVACGDTITSDTTLTADLRNCPGNGLVVNGDAITLDLGGHTIRGLGAGVGITVTGTHVLVKHGAIQGFQDGVYLPHNSAIEDSFTVFSGLTVTRNGVGFLTSIPGGSIEDSKIASNAGDGILFHGGFSPLWTVKDSEISGNGGAGITLKDATAAIERNVITGNVGDGIDLVEFADLTTITDNLVTRNGGFGIHVIDSGTQVLRNTARNNGDDGIFLGEGADPIFLPHYLIADNVSNSNGGHGIVATAGMIDGGGNSAKRNNAEPQCVNVACP